MASIILIIFFVFIVIWFIGLGIYSYHVFSYGMPGDATKKSLLALMAISSITILFVTFFVSGLDWGSL